MAAAVVAWLAVSVATLTGLGLVAAFGGAVAGECAGAGGAGGGAQQIGDRSWSAEQTENAQTIVAAAVGRQLPRRAAVIAVSTAIVESELRNVTYGDRDSLGLFQQRPSQGWGSPATVLNPALAANAFYDHLIAIPGWATMPPGTAAQAVQRSGFPELYQQWEPMARALTSALDEDGELVLRCR
jgi:hypothetical protein